MCVPAGTAACASCHPHSVSSGPHALDPPRAGQNGGPPELRDQRSELGGFLSADAPATMCRHPALLLGILGQKKRGSNENMADHSPEERRLLGPGYRGLFLFSMFLLCAFNFADRAIFSVLAQSIKIDLELTDSDLG